MKGKEFNKVKNAIQELYAHLNIYRKQIKISSPTTAVISRIRGEYRFQILIKSDRGGDPAGGILRKGIESAFNEFKKNTAYKEIKTIIDMDPQTIV